MLFLDLDSNFQSTSTLFCGMTPESGPVDNRTPEPAGTGKWAMQRV
jgi:hypothetical protein